MTPYSILPTSSPAASKGRALFPGIWGLALAGVLAAGALFRLVTIGQDPIWLDEAYTLWFTEQSWEFLWRSMAGVETFPPLYYSLMKVWTQVAGTSEVALRLPSALVGIASILLLAIAGRLARSPALGVMAGGICALWQFQIHYAMEARPYSFAALAVALMLAGAVQVLRNPDALRRPWRDFATGERPTLLGLVAIAFGMALAPWMHVTGAIPTLIAGLYLLGWWAIRDRSGAAFAKLMATAALALLLYLPNFRFVLGLGGRDMADFWLQAPKAWQLLQITVQVYSQKVMALPLKAEAVLMVLLVIGGAVGFWRATRSGAILGLIVALMAGHWLAMVALTYLVQPVLLPRTLIFAQPPLLLLLAGLPWCLPRRMHAVAGLAFLGYLGAGFLLHTVRLNNYADYRQMAAAIAESPDADAPVLVMPGHFILPVTYYSGKADVRAFPRGAPDFTRVPATTTHDPTEAEMADLLASLSGTPSFWVMLGNGMKNHAQVMAMIEAAGYDRHIAVGTADYHPNLNYFTRLDKETLAFAPRP
ncbi:hypothetical protein QCN27_17365 [Cereibacter sp. SYSU M97828]|nr:hypothetical protein [Cereibacter flavus]